MRNRDPHGDRLAEVTHREYEHPRIVCVVQGEDDLGHLVDVADCHAQELGYKLILASPLSEPKVLLANVSTPAPVVRFRSIEDLVDDPLARSAALLVVSSSASSADADAWKRFVESATRPIMIVSPGASMRATHSRGEGSVVCGLDGSGDGFKAATLAGRLASRAKARLVLVYACDAGDADAQTIERRSGYQLLQAMVDLLEGGDRAEIALDHGDPAAYLTQIASDSNARLIVVGARGKSGSPSGSLARRLAHVARVPIVLAPANLASHAGEADAEFDASAAA